MKELKLEVRKRAVTGTLTLKQSLVARPKKTWRETELHSHLFEKHKDFLAPTKSHNVCGRLLLAR